MSKKMDRFMELCNKYFLRFGNIPIRTMFKDIDIISQWINEEINKNK